MTLRGNRITIKVYDDGLMTLKVISRVPRYYMESATVRYNNKYYPLRSYNRYEFYFIDLADEIKRWL